MTEDIRPRPVQIVACDSEEATPYAVYHRMIKALYGDIKPFMVVCQGSRGDRPLGDTEARDLVRGWCRENGVSGFQLTNHQVIYFDSMDDATLFMLAFR